MQSSHSAVYLTLSRSEVEELSYDWYGFSTRYLHLLAGEITSPMDQALDILPLFTKVTYLEIEGWDFQKFNSNSIEQLLGHFYKTVTALMLVDCRANSEVLIYLTSRFPLVENLWVGGLGDTHGQTYEFERCGSPLATKGSSNLLMTTPRTYARYMLSDARIMGSYRDYSKSKGPN